MKTTQHTQHNTPLDLAQFIHGVNKLEDLPGQMDTLGYFLPKWGNFTPYRATAWAYLLRHDGGPFVVKDGAIYALRGPAELQQLRAQRDRLAGALEFAANYSHTLQAWKLDPDGHHVEISDLSKIEDACRAALASLEGGAQ